jgi:hypothetical protein
MLYRVFVQTHLDQDPVALDYALDTNGLVDIWLDCVRTQFTRPWKINHHQWTKTFATAASVAQAKQDIEQTRQELELDLNLDTNSLHLLFHSHYESLTDKILDHRWGRLNSNIHRLEEQQRSLNDPLGQRAGFGFVVTNKGTDLTELRAIPSHLRNHWFHVPKSGELLLGYYTLGKTIADCYRDNDLECVRKGLVRPQQTISTETVCLWGLKPGPIRRLPLVSEVTKWVKDNDLAQYIDLGLKENQYYGQPRLGEYCGDLSIEEINELLENAAIVSVQLID